VRDKQTNKSKTGTRKMSIKSYLIGGMLIVIFYLVLVSQAVKFANKVSQQTEKNFADAIRVMQDN